MKLHVVLGGPGTGKTSRLLQIVEKELSAGVRSTEIAFVAFTKAAADEARARAALKLHLDPKADLPGFRTLHSTAYQLLSVEREEIMDRKDWREFGTIIGERITGGKAEWDEMEAIPVVAKGDALLQFHDFVRTTLADPAATLRELQPEFDLWEAERFAAALTAYKRKRRKRDFTDLLVDVMAKQIPLPGIRVAIVDEAQDLTKLQWQLIRHLFSKVERLYIGGDDDQAIYKWAGADVDTFLALKGTHEHLPLSHRLPHQVHSLAARILARLSARFPKDYQPTKREGQVNRWPTADDIPADLPGTWLLLVRNGYLLRQWETVLKNKGILYRTRWKPSSVVPDHFLAITAWERWRKGNSIPGSAAKVLLPFLGVPVPRGFNIGRDYTATDISPVKPKAPWFDALAGIAVETRAYYQTCMRNGEKLRATPRVRLETIHGVKGAEADHVAIFSDMSQRTWDHYQKDPDTEHRVFYVGVTRAKDTLHLIDPATPLAYPFPSPQED